MNLDGTPREYSPDGYKRVVRAAKDPVAIPTDPVIVGIANRNLCILGLGDQSFKLTGLYGDERLVPYDASVADWERLAREILDITMERNDD